MPETTKEIIKKCKQKISDRYQEYLHSPGAIQFAKYQTDLERILSAHLKKYAENNSEMEELLDWVNLFKNEVMNDNIDYLQKDLLNTSAQYKTKKSH